MMAKLNWILFVAVAHALVSSSASVAGPTKDAIITCITGDRGQKIVIRHAKDGVRVEYASSYRHVDPDPTPDHYYDPSLLSWIVKNSSVVDLGNGTYSYAFKAKRRYQTVRDSYNQATDDYKVHYQFDSVEKMDSRVILDLKNPKNSVFQGKEELCLKLHVRDLLDRCESGTKEKFKLSGALNCSISIDQ
jgi:hypothetical protein